MLASTFSAFPQNNSKMMNRQAQTETIMKVPASDTSRKEEKPFVYGGAEYMKIRYEKSKNTKECIERYIALVDRVADTLKNNLGIAPNDHERFIIEIAKIMYGNTLGMRYELFADVADLAIKHRESCLSSSIFVRDVGEKMGMHIEFIVVPTHVPVEATHVLVKVGEWAFGTTQDSVYYPFSKITEKYPKVYFITSDMGKMMAGAYEYLTGVYSNLAKTEEKAGNTRKAQKYYEKSIDIYRTALKLTPEDAIMYSLAAETFEQMDKKDSALAYYKLSFERDTTSPAPLCEEGLIYFHEKKYQQAYDLFEQALKIKPGYVPAQDNIEIARKKLHKKP